MKNERYIYYYYLSLEPAEIDRAIHRNVVVVGLRDHRLEHFPGWQRVVGRRRVRDHPGGAAARVVHPQEVPALHKERLAGVDPVDADLGRAELDPMLKDVLGVPGLMGTKNNNNHFQITSTAPYQRG